MSLLSRYAAQGLVVKRPEPKPEPKHEPEWVARAKAKALPGKALS